MGNCRCKIWYRVVAVMLVLTFLSAYLPEDIIDLDITASAETYTTEDGFEYTIADGEATITGYSGDATDVVIPNEIEGCSVTSIIGSHYAEKNFENAVSIEIPNSVTEINDYAFFNCKNLTCVIIPDSVIVVGFCAFSQCDSLSSISIPSSVLSIDEMAFADCDILKDIYFSEGLITVGERAFWNCVSLENIIIPNSATSIGDYAFSECNNLKSVALPKRITAIGNYVFENCTELTDINFGDSVTSIGNYAFFNCSTLHYLSIPNGVINIGDSAFAQCDNLSSITFPATIKYIGNSAFYSCDNLNNVLIPNSVTEIGNSAFAYCTGLTNIILPDSITSISDMIFLECRNLLNINIPNGIVSIGSSAFSYCGMNSITIPRSVTQIDTSAFYHLGSDFLICGYAGSYAETYANENNIPFEVIDDTDNDIPKSGKCGTEINWEFTDDGILKIYGTGGMWDYNYSASFPSIISNFDIEQIVISDGITYIGSNAFSGCNAKKVPIPDSVTLIGTYAFNGCYSLTEIIIPNSITSVGQNAFEGCKSLSNVKISNSMSSIPASMFADCVSLSAIEIPTSIEVIGNYAFSGCTSLKDFEIPENVLTIGAYAFYGCQNLNSIIIPKSVTDIYADAFDNCPNLTIYGYAGSYAETYAKGNDIPFKVIGDSETSDTDIFEYEIYENEIHIISCNTTAVEVAVPDVIEGYPVTTLWSATFDGCPNLKTVKLPHTVNYVSGGLPPVLGNLQGCQSLSNVIIDDNNPHYCDVDGVVFTKDGSSLVFYPPGRTETNYIIPNGTVEVEMGAFYCSNSLTEIVLPDSLNTISFAAFWECNNLNHISIPDGVKEIEELAFNGTNVGENVNGVLYLDEWVIFIEESVETIEFREGTKYIANSAVDRNFGCFNGYIDKYSQLKSIIFPNEMLSIGEEAFSFCEKLEKAVIPKTVVSIGNNAFGNCPNLTIYGYADSYAETYANENGIPFVALDDNISFYLSESPIEIYDLTEKTISISSSKPILANTTFICRDTDIVNIKSVVNRSLSDCEVSLTTISFGSTLLDIYVDGEIVSSIAVTVKNINSYESSTLIKPLRESFSLGQNEIINISAQYLGKDKILTAEWDVVDNEIISIERSFTNSIRVDTPFEEKHAYCQIKGKKSGQTVLKLVINNNETAYIPVIVEPITLSVYASRTDLNILEGEYFQIFANTRINDEIIQSDITYSFDDSALKWTNRPLYETGLVSTLQFKALKEGLHTITITDNTYGITKIIPITVDRNKNNTVTIYNVPKEYLYDNRDFCNNFKISGIYIDEFKSSLRRTSAGQVLCDVTFDAYNTKSIFGIVDVYDSNGRLIKSYPINPVKNMPTSIVESTLENLGKLANDIFVEGSALTYRQSAGYSEHTQITINDIPQGGYIRITNNPIESKSLYIIDSIDIILSYKSFSKSSLDNYDSIRNSIANELCKSFPDYFIEALAQDEDKLIKDAIVTGFSKKAISNGFEISIDGFTAVFVNWINECDFNGIVKNVLKNYITDFTEDLFTSASGWIGVTIEQLMNYSKAINLICKINDFTNSIDNARQDIHIPRNGAIGCEDITVIGAFDEYTSLNVFRIQIEDEIINNIPEININNSELICEYDISIYRNGELFQPTSKVSVEIRIPDNLLPYKDKLVIYRVENDGTVTKLVSKLSDNNIITFETEHFSKYLLCPTHTHSFSNLWHYGSTHHWHECNCGEKTDMAVHTENNGVITVQPTATSSGVVTYSCSICDFVTRTVTISPTGGGYIPPSISTPVYPPENPTTSNPDDEEDEEMFDDAEEDYESDEDEESIYEEFEDEEEIIISLDNDLEKLTSGKANINTKKSFFDDSATICLSNTEESYNAALMAIEELGEDNPVFYAFDISIFNEDQIDISDKFSGGYVTFKIPVPKSMVEMTDEISVYHIEDGYPEYLESEIVDYDGFVRVKFSATEFSPFMFIVQGSNASYENPDSDNDDENDDMFIGKDEIQINDGNANPDTNVKTAIIIPTAVIGCVLLLKKPKRKRHR